MLCWHHMGAGSLHGPLSLACCTPCHEQCPDIAVQQLGLAPPELNLHSLSVTRGMQGPSACRGKTPPDCEVALQAKCPEAATSLAQSTLLAWGTSDTAICAQ